MTFTSVIVLKSGILESIQTFVNLYDEETPGQGTIDARIEFEEAVLQLNENATPEEIADWIDRGGYCEGEWDILIANHSPVGLQNE